MPAGSTNQERYRILSIDGGGIRGVFAAVLLDRLAVACPSFLEHVDLVAGTSTGAIIALGLANDLAPS
ncbi:MAG: patatin-like phospholipase family protein, partial [Nitrospiraceae bacterium]